MYLKSCCALLLLALMACQAAPPKPKIIEKKSISEETSKIDKDNLKLEDSGTEKDRAKKSAATFCVEVRSGNQVPCADKGPDLQPLVQLLPSALSQPLRFLQPQQPAPAPQTIHVIQPQQPQPQSANIVLPPPEPQPIQPVHIYMPQPQPQSTNIVFPTVPAPPAQQPSAPCNQHFHPAPQLEHKSEQLKIGELKPRPEPLPLPLPRPIQRVETLPLEPPCKQDLVIVPSRPMLLIPEETRSLQLSTGPYCDRTHHAAATGCACPTCIQSQAYRSKESQAIPPFMPRTHPKIHEHHVMLYPSASGAPMGIPFMAAHGPSCPLMSPNPPYIVARDGPLLPGRYGDTIVTVQAGQEHPSPYPTPYASYPVQAYDTYPNGAQTVTVNAFTPERQLYRASEHTAAEQNPQELSANGKPQEMYPVASGVSDPSKGLGNQKRETDPIQLKDNEQDLAKKQISTEAA